MQNRDSKNQETDIAIPRVYANTSSHVVTADSVQAEEVPTIPLGPLQTISALQPEIALRSVAATERVSMPRPLVVQPSEYHRSLGEWARIWWDGMRPAYLPLSLMPVLLGSVLAWTESITASRTLFGHLRIFPFLAAVVAVLLIQLGAHLINDYYDYLRGIDTSNMLGPGKLIQQGLINPTRVLIFGFIALGLGALAGLFAALTGGPLAFLFGLIGLLCAFFYSATTRALSSLMLGELIAFCIFGPLITLGAYMVQTGQFSRTALLYSVPLGLLAAAVIHVNDMRDAEGDEQAGKRTLASTLGLSLGRALYLVLMLGAYAIIVAIAVPHHAPHLLLLTLWTLPLLVVALTGIFRTDAPAGLHLVMRETLKILTLFTILLLIALVVSALWPLLPGLPAMLISA
ncbi:MAG: 1,4-dihydroxy-2-naphthoate octaprenyltransferase [Chloroflexota bacterium]|nr:1,4-dihydroxy-2-naphthoate octaprenyltransferase [Chloroflexota bacterium]